MIILGIFGTVCTIIPVVAAYMWNSYKTNNLDNKLNYLDEKAG